MKHILKGNADSRKVWLNGKLLNPSRSQQRVNHSPDGFSWGYGGSGAAQLALAIMLELAGDTVNGNYDYHQLKWDVIAKLPMEQDFETEFKLKS